MEKMVSHSEQKLLEAEEIIKLIENYEKNTIDKRVEGLTKELHDLPNKWALFKNGKKQEARRVEIRANKIQAEISENNSFKNIVSMIKTLLSYRNLEPLLIVRPQALSKLVQVKTGNQSLDLQNKKLLDLYNRLLEKDEANYEKARQERHQKIFDKIRKTEFYKGRKKENHKMLQDSDNSEFIPAIRTFKELFSWMNEILNSFGLKEDFKHVDKYEVPIEDTDYQKTTDNVGKNIKIMNDSFEKLKKYASPEEIAEYEKGYKALVDYHKKFVRTRFYRHLVEISNLERQKLAIEHTIKTLLGNKVRSTDSDGIYKETITMLEEAKQRCKAKLESLGYSEVKDYLKNVAEYLDGVDNIVEELQRRDKEVQEQKAEAERKRRLEERKREEEYERMSARLKANQAVLDRMELRRIMEELRPIVLEQIDPKLINYNQTGVDSWDRDDSAYVQEFNSKMRYELIKRGINPEGVTIISPYESDIDQYSGGGYGSM